jgi:choline dehydrogenase
MSSNIPGSVSKTHYDFVVYGSGSSGSVIARRLAENPAVEVLLLEAGGDDNAHSVTEAARWTTNIGGERDWGFTSQPDSNLNGRSVPLSMGKALGGGSTISTMIWARGHQTDWDFFASEAGDPAWNYQSVLNIYRCIEDWHGEPDPKYRGVDGIPFVEPAPNPNPMAVAMLKGCQSLGIPVCENQNGRMMEGEGGASIVDIRVRDGKRQSVFRSYVFPYIDRPNLMILPHALVTRLIFDGKKAAGVEIVLEGKTKRILATSEVTLGHDQYPESVDAIWYW